MSGKQHTFLYMSTRVVLFIAAVVLLVEFLWSDVVLDALMGLVFAGVVPGTGIVLSPESMLMGTVVLVGIFATYGLIRFALYMRSLLRGRHLQAATTQQSDVITTLPVPRSAVPKQKVDLSFTATLAQTAYPPASRRTIALPSISVRPLRKLVRASFGSRLVFLIGWVSRVSRRASTLYIAFAHRILALLVRIARISQWLLAKLWLRAAIIGASLYKRARILAIRAWRWLVPRMWQFDAFIERQVKAGIRRIHEQVMKRENAAFLLQLGERTMQMTPIAGRKKSK